MLRFLLAEGEAMTLKIGKSIKEVDIKALKKAWEALNQGPRKRWTTIHELHSKKGLLDMFNRSLGR